MAGLNVERKSQSQPKSSGVGRLHLDSVWGLFVVARLQGLDHNVHLLKNRCESIHLMMDSSFSSNVPSPDALNDLVRDSWIYVNETPMKGLFQCQVHVSGIVPALIRDKVASLI